MNNDSDNSYKYKFVDLIERSSYLLIIKVDKDVNNNKR